MEVVNYWDYKHPLEHTWTLWYLDSTRTKNWEECLMEVGSFSTIEDFWCFFNHIKPVSHLKVGCDYSLFKRGIRPMWEDDANKDGGRWMINVDKKTTTPGLDKYWLELVMCMIGECFTDHNENVNGATVNIRGKGNRISLWTRNTSNENGGMIKLGLKLKSVIGLAPNQVITFQTHQDCAKNNSSLAKATYFI
uniref:eIF-4F 25 kDa subunit n=1 Tax=Lygus hesperus TaxID=30085 RepID=A0A0A9YM05_LYGHE